MTLTSNNIQPLVLDTMDLGSKIDKEVKSCAEPKVQSNHFFGRTWTAVKGAAPVIVSLFIAALVAAAWHLDKQRKLANAKALEVKQEPSPTDSTAKASPNPSSLVASPKAISDVAENVLEINQTEAPAPSIVIDGSASNDARANIETGEPGSSIEIPKPYDLDVDLSQVKFDKVGGFENGGNTCYAASTMQALFAMPNFFETYLANGEGNSCVKKPDETLEEYTVRETLHYAYHCSRQGKITPKEIMSQNIDLYRLCGWNPTKNLNAQEDAEEFCDFVMKKLHFKKFSSHKVLQTEQGSPPSNLLSFENIDSAFRVSLPKTNQPIELSDLVMNERTNLGERNAIYAVRMDDEDLPAILPIQLKRYKKEESLNHTEKDSSPVIPSAELIIPLAFNEKMSARYVLGSCIVRSGAVSNINQGHYYTYNKEVVEGKEQWTKLEDGQVSICDEATAKMDIQENGYLFFYKAEGLVQSK